MLSKFRTGRRVALSTGVLVGAAALTVGLAVPASAVTVPDWPTAGYLPTESATCSITGAPLAGSSYNIVWADSGLPRITDAWFNSGSSVVALPGASTSYKIRARAVQRCSGVGSVRYITGGAAYSYDDMAPETTDAFGGTWAATRTALPSNAGKYYLSLALVTRRYDAMTLSDSYTLVGKTNSATGIIYAAGLLKPLYVLRGVKFVSLTQSKTTVARGSSVTFRATMQYATDVSWVANNGETVKVQTKVGTGSWTTKATLTANSSGQVSYSFAPTKTTQVRFVHVATTSGRFTAAATSTAKTIKVT